MPFNYDFKKILFLDIETVSIVEGYDLLNDRFKKLWQRKANAILKRGGDLEPDGDDYQRTFEDKAGIFAEFGKIVCISMVYISGQEGQWSLRVKSIAGHDEKLLLLEFRELLDKHFNDADQYALCGHNIKEFDIPYLCRRMVIHQIPFPVILDVSGKKPWEVKQFIDTMDLWKFGDAKQFTSLDLLAASLDIPTPKDDIAGAEVGQVYWQQQDLDRIVTYCQKDVITVVQILRRLAFQPLFEDHQIVYV